MGSLREELEREGELAKRLLTPGEVAEFLALPVRTLYTWRYRGEGPPALKVGGHLRYDPVALRRWLDGLSA